MCFAHNTSIQETEIKEIFKSLKQVLGYSASNRQYLASDRQIDTQRDRHIERQTDRQTDKTRQDIQRFYWLAVLPLTFQSGILK